MKRIFILEDDPERIKLFHAANAGRHDVTVAMDIWAAKKEFRPPYDVIYLDHDLGGQVYVDSDEENTGFQFCRFLTEPSVFESLKQTPFIVHSYNPDGAYNMCMLLKKAGYIVYQIPFGATVLNHLEHL